MASQPTDPAVFIGCGDGADLAITKANDLVFIQEYAPGLKCRVNLGRATKARIAQIKSHLSMLECHAVE